MPLQLISQLKFTVEDNREIPGGKDLMVTKYFQPQGHYRPTSGRWAHFDPSLPISGIWERKATVSMLRFEDVHVSYTLMLDFKQGSKIKIFLELLKAAQLGGEQYPHSYYDMEGHYYFFHMITLGTGEGVESAKENEGGEGGSAKGGE